MLLAALAAERRPAAAQDRPCGAASAAVRFDHVTIAVADLEAASSTFRDRLGFSLKPGRVHDNGLQNMHVRLAGLADGAVVFRGEAFDWVSFPDGHPLHSIFFVDVRTRTADEPDQLRHENGAAGLSEVWVEISEPGLLGEMLGRFGSSTCGRLERPGGRAGLGHGLGDGTLVAVPVDAAPKERRVVGVILKSERRRPERSANGVWLGWEGLRP